MGDDSNGLSWAKAIHAIQAALDAVPDGRNGLQILIRPDPSMEADLTPAYKGVEGWRAAI